MPSPESMTDETEVTRFLTDYYRDFSSLDLQSILAYYHEPCLTIGPQGVFAASTRSVLATALAPILENLRSRGYGRSELSIQHLQALSAATALVTGVALRYKADGQELERVGLTYLLQKADRQWKIAVLVTHDTHEVARNE